MKANKQELFEESLKRLKTIKAMGMKQGAKFLNPAVVNFEKNHDVSIYERQNYLFKSIHYDLYGNAGSEDYDKMIARKEEIENKFGCQVFLMQITYTEFGKLVHMFTTSGHKEEWEMENSDINEQYSSVYTYNMDDDMCSECGTVSFKFDNVCGGIYVG